MYSVCLPVYMCRNQNQYGMHPHNVLQQKKTTKTLKYVVHSSGKNVQKDFKIVRSILVLDFVVTLTGF